MIAAATWRDPAIAAGGAHAVDDAFVETPGDCHAENWLVLPARGGSVLHLGIGCTRPATPRLEIGGSVERASAQGSVGHLIAPALKYTLVDDANGLALGMRLDMALDDDRGRVAAAGLTVPVSLTVQPGTALNINLGWQFTHAAARAHRLFWGLQIDHAVISEVSIMGEIHGAGSQRPGAQAGLRITPAEGRCDIDLLASHGPGDLGTMMTIGVTARW